MLNETGDLVKRKSEKVDVLNAFLVSVFSGKTIMLQESQVPETKEKDWSKEDVSLVEEYQVREYLSIVGIHNSMGLNGLYPQVLRKMVWVDRL